MALGLALKMNFKIGDLVDFSVSAWIFKSAERDYKSPGVVLEVESEVTLPRKSTKKATVLWADGRTTKEYFGYLRESTIENR